MNETAEIPTGIHNQNTPGQLSPEQQVPKPEYNSFSEVLDAISPNDIYKLIIPIDTFGVQLTGEEEQQIQRSLEKDFSPIRLSATKGYYQRRGTAPSGDSQDDEFTIDSFTEAVHALPHPDRPLMPYYIAAINKKAGKEKEPYESGKKDGSIYRRYRLPDVQPYTDSKGENWSLVYQESVYTKGSRGNRRLHSGISTPLGRLVKDFIYIRHK